ncbi:protoporphyrinogen oxidase HemJ [Rickettsia endosymbiont of Culicoides newsteadi]|uniref:protoporphyrinogen oxidase HemJ n=1 Tax=Rickettsia endosymbiont of Culicoides newsteadi TaxID=1961830 RepID=UPI000B9AEF9D|nr:protoporphyrinogen oxidase HemJ [Rickettsia endosymbiont of Culicoides newsteadi]OZG32038.1 membrane protein [Rickettsia endosymbiont of Culicoides newsteadi]
MASYYLWFKAFHLISAISWMVGLLYLPRLYVYHSRVAVGSESDKTFQLMESKLLRIIMNPAMISTYTLGIINSYIYGLVALGTWFYIKMTAVLGITIFHGLLSRWRKNFVDGKNNHSEKFYRIVNEVPALLMIIAVIMVIVRPFD